MTTNENTQTTTAADAAAVVVHLTEEQWQIVIGSLMYCGAAAHGEGNHDAEAGAHQLAAAIAEQANPAKWTAAKQVADLLTGLGL